MFRLRIGYLISGIATGLVVIFNILWSLPDGKLHIVFCNVGQGDATYVRFPDGRDLLVDGGPGNGVISCLSRHMPFWDRTLTMVLLTHPEKDHAAGLVSVLARYRVEYFLHSDVRTGTDTETSLFAMLRRQRAVEKAVFKGGIVRAGRVTMRVIWPSDRQIALDKARRVLGVSTEGVNRDSVVFWLRYGSFDTFFPGDADTGVSGSYVGSLLSDDHVELLKVPHHGSKTGMDNALLNWLRPDLSVISVGKNSFGHPAAETLRLLATYGARVLRTDLAGDIEIISDGRTWRRVY